MTDVTQWVQAVREAKRNLEAAEAVRDAADAAQSAAADTWLLARKALAKAHEGLIAAASA